MPLDSAALRRFGGAAVLAAVIGCGAGPTEPDLDGTVYELSTLNESALPWDHEGLGCCTYLNGELRFLEGLYTASLTARNRNTGVTFTVIERGTYHQGSVITFVRESYEVQPLLLDVGLPREDEIRLSFGGEGPGSADQFRAVFVRGP
jgi:hypothetical protein